MLNQIPASDGIWFNRVTFILVRPVTSYCYGIRFCQCFSVVSFCLFIRMSSKCLSKIHSVSPILLIPITSVFVYVCKCVCMRVCLSVNSSETVLSNRYIFGPMILLMSAVYMICILWSSLEVQGHNFRTGHPKKKSNLSYLVVRKLIV